jgi:hypothetical protein
MTNRTLLNNIDHHDLKVAARHGPEFGDSVNHVLVLPAEFEEVQREFAILFRRDSEGALQAFALLGLDRGENLFLDETGWQSRYVPAIQRRGPFLIGVSRREGAEDQPTIHVDLEDGEPLFLQHGGNAPYLEQVAAALRTIYSGMEVQRAMFAAFEEAGLIRPVAVEIMLSEERRYDLPDFSTIDQDRLAALDGATLERLNRAGFLRLAMFAAASLANVNRLVELKRRRAG